MPNRFSRLLSKLGDNEKPKEDTKQAASQTDSTRTSKGFGSYAPSSAPEYGAEAAPPPPDYDTADAIFPPDLTAGFSNLRLSHSQNSELPQTDECIAHLKVLECFYRLRQVVGSTDGLFGFEDKVVSDFGLTQEKSAELLAKLAEKRWAVYVCRAVERFEKWLSALLALEGRGINMLSNREIKTSGQYGRLVELESGEAPLKIDGSNIPPADVLMVWHAYMLNPRAYLEDCLRLKMMPLWFAGFPWQAAVDAINSETFEYMASDAAMAAFTDLTGLSWKDSNALHARQVICPACETVNEVEYTTCSQNIPQPVHRGNAEEASGAIHNMLMSGEGFCDPNLQHHCSGCGTLITHEKLKAKKMCNDIELCLKQDVPMGGTVLGLKGLAWNYASENDVQYEETCVFPNNLIKFSLGEKILATISQAPREQNIKTIRDVIESVLKHKRTIRQCPGSKGVRLTRPQRIGIRRMMSRYWENHSSFAIDLVGAVVRQGAFIEKMHNIDWLHSPALPSTMQRLLTKYKRFVSIMADATHMAVPTLDVDLAWHTHQLSPATYLPYTVRITKQFIDHDDKVAETKLNDAFAWTSKTYQKQWGEPYSECTCWYCEAVRESITSTVARIFRDSTDTMDRQLLHTPDPDPRKNVHISAHNAVRPSDAAYAKAAAAKTAALEKSYAHAADRARRNGRKPPKRGDYYYSDAYGYPVYIPAYNPCFVGGIYTPGYYPISPGCVALGAGQYGNCCSGTCGGNVAAGGCAGSGVAAGGCVGGAAGGCAGGAAGGCVGGGGGGGGGCGGGGGGGGGCGGGGGG